MFEKACNKYALMVIYRCKGKVLKKVRKMKAATYVFSNGYRMTSKLSIPQIKERLSRLKHLIVLTENFENEDGESIYKKAYKAYHKKDNFTGVIRLNEQEKDFISYLIDECDMLSEKDIETYKYYLK